MPVTKPVKQIECRDSVVKSLVVITYPSTDSITYCMRGTTKDRRRIKLGTSKDLTLTQARIKALEVEGAGCNNAALSLSQVFEQYEQSGEYSGKRSMGRERKRYDSIVAPIIGKKEIIAINLADIQAVLASLRTQTKEIIAS